MVNELTGLRELAYFARVEEIRPIPGYDRVEHARIGAGWWLIVKKDEFKVGDVGVYIEYDSKVPAEPPFEFLEKRDYKIKIIKMCKVRSEGILMHPSDFGWTLNEDKTVTIPGESKAFQAGDFLTERLKIVHIEDGDNLRKTSSADTYRSMQDRHKKIFKTKWAKWLMKRAWGRKIMFFFFGKKKDKRGWNWSWVSKSDQERCQNLPYVFEDQDASYIETTKIDGTSSTFVLEKVRGKWQFSVCSRNVVQDDERKGTYHSADENVYWQVANKWKIKDFLKAYAEANGYDGVALQGETAGCSLGGAKLQGDPHQFGELRFFGYDLYVKGIGKTDVLEAKKACEAFGIEWVPVVNLDYHMPKTCEELLDHATGPCEAPGAKGLREGYVYRRVGEPNRSFKAVSPEYLLKHNN